MLYAQLILGKKGTLGKVWLAVQSEKKLNRQLIFQTDLTKSADKIANPKGEVLPLRVSGSLLLGVVRIYSHKVRYLSTDCDDALAKMKVAFRPDALSQDICPTSVQPLTPHISCAPSSTVGAVPGNGSCMRLRTTRKLPGTRGEGELSNEGGGRNPGEEAKANLLGEGVTQRWKLEDGLPPLSREWAAAAALTLARRQDICLPETEEEGGGRKEVERRGLGGVDGEGKLGVYGGIGAGGMGGWVGSREADKEEGRSLAVGGWQVKEEGKEVEDWEVFDPCKVGVQEGFMLSGLVQSEGDMMVGIEGMELGRYGEEGGGEMSFGGEDEASWRGKSAVRMDVVGRDTEEEEEGEGGCAMEVSREGTTEGGEAGSGREEATRTLPSLQVKGTPEHKLVSGLAGADDDGREGEAMGEGERDYDLAAARPLRFGGRASLSWRWGRRGSSMGIAEGGTEGKEGRRKRRLPMETSLVLSGAEMKAQMADTRDIMLERVRPRDRQRGVGRDGGKKGEREVGLRMQAHALTGQLAEGLEGAIRKMMRPAPGFLLPIATREGWREAGREGGRQEGAGSGRVQKRRREEKEGCECEGRREEGGGGGAGDTEDGFRLGEKREAETGFRQVGHDRKGGLPNDGPVLGVRTLHPWHGMLRGPFSPHLSHHIDR